MSALSREKIVEEARTWLGTPYRHQASVRGVGADCLGLVRGVWRGLLGTEPERPPAYNPHWAELTGEDTLIKAARRHMTEVAVGGTKPGDVLLFRMALGAPAKHVAILTAAQQIIHAYWGRAVVETKLVPWWTRRIVGAFRFPGVED